MKVLIVNEFYKCGGAEVYAFNLKKLLNEHGNTVKLLCFSFNEQDVFEENDKNVDFFKIEGSYNKILFNPLLYLQLSRYLKKYNPDLIIINNIFSAPYTQLLAFGKYKCIQVIHDYSIVCPKGTCIYNKYEICDGYTENACLKKCKYQDSKLKLFVKRTQLQIENKIRKNKVDYFISPSRKLANYLEKYGFKVQCINNPIGNMCENNEWKEKISNKKNYIYVGEISEKKGVLYLLEQFMIFSKDKDVALDLVGKIHKESEDVFYKAIGNNKKINYLGVLSHEEVIDMIGEYYCMVVPSIWMENYPTTVLEAMLCGTLVIGSDRGGIPEMLENNRGIIFNTNRDLLEKLRNSYDLSLNDYDKMVHNAYDYVKNNNSMENFYNKFIKEIDMVMRK